ncbi:MAG TPA: tetratricopeptide repeat protein, partial [Nannocystis sp.]
HARRVPRWLRRVCMRGLAPDPERRFASMQALLDALTKGRIRARMRTWLMGVSALVALGASAALHRHHQRAERIAACDAAGAGIADVWNDEARARVREGLLATGLGYAPATADKVMSFLDRQAEDWRRHRSRACLQADIERSLEPEQLDRAVWCLDERRMDLAALIAELARADATVVQQAVTAAAGLQPVSPCTDARVLAALPSPPPLELRAKADAVRTTLSQVRTLRMAGKYPDALALSRTALADAEALGWPPMTAAVRRLEGDLLGHTGAYPEAEVAVLRAYMEAAKVRAWDVAAAAAINLAWIIGDLQARYAESKVWVEHADVALGFAGDPLGLHEALRLSHLAAIFLATGAYADAKPLLERALAIRERSLGPEHPYVADSLMGLANAHWYTGAYAEAKELHERALAIREETLGPDHPHVASSLNNLAAVHWVSGAYSEAKALLERTLAIREKALGPEHPDVGAALGNLAAVHAETGAYAEAKALLERSLVIREKALGPEHPRVADALDNLGAMHRATGAHAEARALHERALAIRERALGPDHPDVASSLHNLAHMHQATGAHAEAKALHERALAIREKALGPDHPLVASSLVGLGELALAQHRPADALRHLERAVAIYDAHDGLQENEPLARYHLARALVRTGGDRARALAEARKAIGGFRELGDGAREQLAEVEAFLARHGSGP